MKLPQPQLGLEKIVDVWQSFVEAGGGLIDLGALV
jgi:hypothetical protein